MGNDGPMSDDAYPRVESDGDKPVTGSDPLTARIAALEEIIMFAEREREQLGEHVRALTLAVQTTERRIENLMRDLADTKKHAAAGSVEAHDTPPPHSGEKREPTARHAPPSVGFDNWPGPN